VTSNFLTPKLSSLCSGQFRGLKGLSPREIISLENGKLSGFPTKKNNIPHFLNPLYINSYKASPNMLF
jgi:hypothetical protein